MADNIPPCPVCGDECEYESYRISLGKGKYQIWWELSCGDCGFNPGKQRTKKKVLAAHKQIYNDKAFINKVAAMEIDPNDRNTNNQAIPIIKEARKLRGE